MLTLYHAPNSRSTRIVQLIHEMGVSDQVSIQEVTIPRQDGSGAVDTANPHPEGKVPCLVHDGAMIRESDAIMLYLTDHFGDNPLGRSIGAPGRGAYLSWLSWYGNVLEPLIVMQFCELSHPGLQATYRDLATANTRLEEALTTHAYLVDDQISAADILISSTYGWAPQLMPDIPAIRDWATRCLDRPATKAIAEQEKSVA
ncbi:glutathione S-transferase family protein [Primorskyibacter flagellatus]|uniref:Glutathione S-transferase n=1 Tax=Primorskyibacter flagellatus TaxID=1387277 RepID=A0A1W1Z5J9_9RHOB|nr:glutathione S-transferase family protein [Primorskyibacter flagellatus]SMC43729.1 glutathione S-transferase [Primorskyibacter flagellatus]